MQEPDPTTPPATPPDLSQLDPAAYGNALDALSVSLRTSDPAAVAQEQQAIRAGQKLAQQLNTHALAAVGCVLEGRHPQVVDLFTTLRRDWGDNALRLAAGVLVQRCASLYPSQPVYAVVPVPQEQLDALPPADRDEWEAAAQAATDVLNAALAAGRRPNTNLALATAGLTDPRLCLTVLCILAAHTAALIELAQDIAGDALQSADAVAPLDITGNGPVPPRHSVFPSLG